MSDRLDHLDRNQPIERSLELAIVRLQKLNAVL